MRDLFQAGNAEQAQVEAEWYRDFIGRHKMPISPEALSLISNIYKANLDDRSATLMLSEAELSARRDPNPETKAALLGVLVKECGRWDLPDLALSVQQMLNVAQDSIRARAQRKEKRIIEQQLDSLIQLRKRELAQQASYFQLEREKAYLLGVCLLLVLLSLVFSNFYTSRRWRTKLKKKEVEMELVQGRLKNNASLPFETPPLGVSGIEPKSEAPGRVLRLEPVLAPQGGGLGEPPSQIALIIEPNRQIILYLKSLLADRFQIETAATPIEGMQMAQALLPDLIVCDAILNGKTGIDVSRQLKLSDKTSHIPIVLLSDHHGNEGKLDALRAGADVWFTRPILDDHFDASIQRLLDSRKAKHAEFQRFLHLYFSEHKISIDNSFITTTVGYIERNLADPDFSAEFLAKHLQLSKQHFYKKLMVLTGKEPVQLIREMRLEKAKFLLDRRAGTPQAISELVGFSNVGTFGLAFKEYFGENTLLLRSDFRS